MSLLLLTAISIPCLALEEESQVSLQPKLLQIVSNHSEVAMGGVLS